MRNYLEKIATWLLGIGINSPGLDSHELAFDLRAIVRDIERQAVRSGVPEIVKVCQVRSAMLSVATARQLISECLATLPTQQPKSLAMLTAKDVAARLVMSERTVWRMQAAGELPEPVRIGKNVRWNQDQFNVWVATGCPVGS